MLAVVTVTTNLDLVNINDGVTSLREAIFVTNTVPGADEIVFDFGHDGPETILLTQGELQITDSLTISGPGAELLRIDASGNDPSPDINNSSGTRVFHVNDRDVSNVLDVLISGVSLTGGDVGGHFSENEGGAIRSVSESLTLDSVAIYDNSVGYRGGGVSATGTLNIFNSQIFNNITRVSEGGGIYASGTTIIEDSSLTRNSSVGDGGGIWTTGNTAIVNSTISGNHSRGLGGGVYGRANLTLKQSTISDNSAKVGGGVWAIGTQKIRHSTITDNEATLGGGFYSPSNRLTLSHSIVAENSDSQGHPDFLSTLSLLTLNSSIIGDRGDLNIAEAPDGSPDANGNLIGGPDHGAIDPLLGPLEDNGGPTKTHALLPGSPAINAGDLNAEVGVGGVPEFDQRGAGFDRIFSNRIDIGAYEVQQLSDLNLLVDTLVDESDGDYRRGDLSLREAIKLTNANLGKDTIRFDPILFSDGPATIVLTILGEIAPVYFGKSALRLTDSANVIGPGSDLLTIDASGLDPTPEIDDGAGVRVMRLGDDYSFTKEMFYIEGLTITGADTLGDGGGIISTETLTLLDVNLVDNRSRFLGGGLLVRRGKTVVANSVIENNRSGYGAGLGTGRIISGAGSELVIRNSVVKDNRSFSHGGGIYVSYGDLTVEDSYFVNNSMKRGQGGAIFVQDDKGFQSAIYNSTFEGNRAGDGGAIASERSAEVLVQQSTFSGNRTGGSGGAIYGGSTNLRIENSTITHNLASLSGPRIGWGGGVGGGATINNSIVFGNSDGSGVYEDLGGRFLGQYNLFGKARQFIDGGSPDVGSNNLVGVDPLLGPLKYNGGPTKTHALLPGSPAINSGDPDFKPPPTHDQRGFPFQRVSRNRIDIGAVEFQRLPGDFDRNAIADTDDLNRWEASYNTNQEADADEDGLTTGIDFLAWQISNSLSPSEHPPSPSITAASLSLFTPYLPDLALAVDLLSAPANDRSPAEPRLALFSEWGGVEEIPPNQSPISNASIRADVHNPVSQVHPTEQMQQDRPHSQIEDSVFDELFSLV